MTIKVSDMTSAIEFERYLFFVLYDLDKQTVVFY